MNSNKSFGDFTVLGWSVVSPIIKYDSLSNNLYINNLDASLSIEMLAIGFRVFNKEDINITFDKVSALDFKYAVYLLIGILLFTLIIYFIEIIGMNLKKMKRRILSRRS